MGVSENKGYPVFGNPQVGLGEATRVRGFFESAEFDMHGECGDPKTTVDDIKPASP